MAAEETAATHTAATKIARYLIPFLNDTEFASRQKCGVGRENKLGDLLSQLQVDGLDEGR
jgi:hypothetical protein